MYEIADYDERYRPYDKSGGELRRADWVKLPVKPRGDGLGELLEHRRGLEIFGVWCLLLEKATAEKPENRGKLLNHREQSASIPEIAKGISLKNRTKLVEEAISVLISIGWVKSERTSAELPQTPAKSSVVKSSVEKSKYIYAEFVSLTSEEYDKLCQKFSKAGADERIQELSDGIGSKGYKYRSHYFTILNWERRREKKKAEKEQTEAHRKRCVVCGKPGVKYRIMAGEEVWRCEEHPYDQPSKAPQIYKPKSVPPAKDRQAEKVRRLKQAKEL